MALGCDKSFASKYMLLKPEEASYLELSKILFSSDLGKRKFVDCSEGDDEPFERRLIIFFSVLAQKAFQAMAKPMAGFGSRVEHYLNLLILNGGFFRLILNLLTGKVVDPDNTSDRFLSVVGSIDTRIELDSKIKHEDARYYAALSIMAAKLSYESRTFVESVVEDHWKMDFVRFDQFWNDYQEKATTHAFVLEDKKSNVIIVSFRGTQPFDADAWCSDVDLSWYELPAVGKIHAGFLKALGLQQTQGWPQQQDPHKPQTAYYAIRNLLKQKLQNNDKAKFIVTGHSLGGALAVLFPVILAMHQESWLLDRIQGIYTFGQPRVGDENFAQYMEKTIENHKIKYYRFVYSSDMVPRLPWDDSALMFKHFGICIYYNSFYQGKVVAEEPNKNYFSLIWVIPKIVNACWELIRSFIISYTKGADYKEGDALRMMRVIGLFLPGVSSHWPQDYVNSTRLGSADLFIPTLCSNDHKMLKMQ